MMNKKFLMPVSDLSGNDISCSKVVEKFEDILNFMNECNKVKYACYRASLKLRVMQKSVFMDKISLKIINSIYEKHQLQKTDNLKSFGPIELEPVISDMYFIALKDMSHSRRDFICQLLINLLLNIYDKEEKKKVLVLSSKIFLALICQDKPREKYLYMFYQLMDLHKGLPKKKLQILLKNLIQVIEFIGEENTFGMNLIPGTIESCFKNKNDNIAISEENFMSWLMEDPQLLVWFSTFYRLQISEKVSHKVKCNICKIYPIVGLRYKCLRCFSCNMCQTCFFAGMIKKKHKLNHPIREYCLVISFKKSCKAFLLTLQNILCKKQTTLQYLPAHKSQVQESENLNPTIKLDELHTSPNNISQSRLQNIILSLKMENEKLIPQLEVMSKRLESLKCDENLVEVLNCLLKHKFQIENLIHRLSSVQHSALPSIEADNKNIKIPIASTPLVNLFVSKNYRKKFNKKLVNFSPIKTIEISHLNPSKSDKLEKKLMWHNYDFGNTVTNSWEELQTNINETDAIVLGMQERCFSTQSLSYNSDNEYETRIESSQMLTNEESNFLPKEIFTWLLKSNENSDSEYISCCENRFIENDLKDVQHDLKQTVDKLRVLSKDLVLEDDNYEKDTFHFEIENVESLLTSLIEGVGKFVEVQEKKK